MDAACTQFRDEWLGGNPAGEHAHGCFDCASWLRLRERQRRSLELLARVPAPAELDTQVALELVRGPAVRIERVERVLASLVRLGAPADLDARVSAVLGAPPPEVRGREKAAALRALDVQQAPPVLERLLDEELADAARHTTERFPGSLRRMRAPEELEQRLGALIRRRRLARLVAAPLTALGAAALVVWIAVRDGTPEARPYSFQVVHADSLEGLDPMARVLAESIGGADPR